uniref:Peptidyl-prolyl cis-trans isomerase n=1 Tax=Oryza punctata TaxID=4537 RepID=A0A0E0MH02_ORYPU
MAALLRGAGAAAAMVLLLAAAASTDGATSFYASDPNLGSARVVFQVLHDLPPFPRVAVLTKSVRKGAIFPRVHGGNGAQKSDLARQFDLQTTHGDIEFGFFPHVAPKTVEHIYKLVRLGCYNTNHFFRGREWLQVDKGFVAQVASVVGGRTAPMNDEQQEEAEKSVVGEFSTVKHVRGILSMGRHSDPNSGGSSFSILLGDAPHLDGQYAVFGRLTKGDDTLRKLEQLPTRREGIFVMPIERISILSTYYYDVDLESCEAEKSILRRRLSESASEVERWRRKCFA